MKPVVMLAVKPAIEAEWRDALTAASASDGPEIDLRLPGEAAPETVDVLVYAFNGAVQDFRPFTGLKAILNIWAGVEKVLAIPTLPSEGLRLPPKLEGLERLAYNLYWSWHPEVRELFSRIDRQVWAGFRSPVSVLRASRDWT